MAEQKTFTRSRVSIDVDTIFSCIREDKAFIRVSYHDNKIYLNFSKANPTGGDRINITHTLSMDGVFILKSILDP